jgi:hypothetical protein
MSAALPIELTPLRFRSVIYQLLGTISVISIFMWFASDNRLYGSAAGIRYVFAANCLLIGAIGAIQMMGLTRARQVIGKQLMPNALWRTWLRASVVETSLIWAFLVVGMSVLLASRTSNTPWPAAIALLSCSLSLGAAVALASRSILPKRAGLIAYLVASVIISFLVSTDDLLTRFVSQPPLVLGVMALAWPVLAAVLIRRGRRKLRAYRWSPPRARSRMLAAIDSQWQRISPLDASNISITFQAAQEGAMRSAWLSWVSFQIYLFVDSFSPLVLQQEPDARHLISLALLCLAMSQSLAARDLHWRALLMPGGWKHKQIASRIFICTLTIQATVVAVAAGVFILKTRLVNLPFSLVLETVVNHIAPLLCELALAISVGLLIRALPHRNAVTLVAAGCIACCWMYARFVVGYAMLPRAPAVGLIYVAVMALLTIVSLAAANRMWTPDKLLASARRR